MKTDQSIDEKLVESFKKGDKKALATLVKRWHKLFCNKAYWMVKDKDAAKDIAQDTWAIIIHRISTLKDPKQFKYWAYRVVCNKSTDWLRLQAKKRNKVVGYTFEIESDSTEYSENDQLKQKLLKAINDLPVNQKVIVRLFYMESYSLKQISDLQNISVGTVKSRLFHAREKLKTILNIKTKHS
ncbi:RNA polymerase sigma factor [Ichthyenterobacterium sp. W332]|uniref:RNA polymerase sigma factor n=1 Tax=Microcosmobacter mediterraneus TaxID=3075607 RepID=A0ABU2YIA8_9FLAO|nr:RNA polymerase sigma factor [Ichthyenterobacterium sp. W332]MDT0557429.1 RNA polymerase sigma factor [Ichthyenterobacterium sp. W332]